LLPYIPLPALIVQKRNCCSSVRQPDRTFLHAFVFWLKLSKDNHMANSFTLHPDAWLREGPDFASGEVVGYRGGGMADGKTARIANFGAPNRNDWRVMRINGDNTQSEWTGHYESAEDALADLQEGSK
jgi:hypothetical protein